MSRSLVTFAAVLCLSIGLAACGDDNDETTETETKTGAVATQPTPTEAQPPPGPGTEGPDFFRTPSRNIGCHVSKQGARCDIAERDWKPTPANEPCRVDFGNGITLNSSGAKFTCAGDTTLGAPTVLEYDQRAQRGRFFCDSTREGVTCSNLETGAGFFIGRQSYRIF